MKHITDDDIRKEIDYVKNHTSRPESEMFLCVLKDLQKCRILLREVHHRLTDPWGILGEHRDNPMPKKIRALLGEK